MKINRRLLFLSLSFLVITAATNAKASETFRLWYMDYSDMTMVFKEKTFPKKISPQGILDFLFNSKKDFRVEVMLIKHGIAYVNLTNNPEHITEQSGSFGAIEFKAKVVFNLTEFKNINCVYFVDFGSHFVWGVKERLDYWDYMTNYRKELNKDKTKLCNEICD